MRLLKSTIVFFLTLALAEAYGAIGGRDVYVAKCSACHALDGSGNSTIGRSMKLADIRPSIDSTTDEQLRHIILHGKARMPPVKKIDEQKLLSLTLFLRDLASRNPNSGRAATEAKKVPLSNVEQIFREKCSACHAQDGTGRCTIGRSLNVPDLTGFRNHSTNALVEAIAKGRGRMPGYAKTFNGVQIEQLISYIRALTVSGDAAKRGDDSRVAPLSLGITSQPNSVAGSTDSQEGTAPLKPHAVRERPAREPEPKNSTAWTGESAVKSGRQIYVAKCTACHSSDGSGTGTVGKSMRIPSLTSPQVQGKSDETLVNAIRTGVGRMPVFSKKANPADIRLLVIYIRELGKRG